MASFLIPLLCALLYPIGTLMTKRALEKGVDLWTAMAVNYWCMALVFLIVIPFESRSIPWHLWYQPAAMGLLSFAGQGCALKAISAGDLTIATPALGSKVLLVALLTETLLQQNVPLAWWVAAAFSFAAVFFLQAGTGASRRRSMLTLAFSMLAAACFALGDVLIQKWAPYWGVFHFLPAMALATAACSVTLLPFMKKPLPAFAAEGRKWLLLGSLIQGGQSLLLTAVIGLLGQVTLVNIVFSSRGLWNFLLIWFAGHWFANREREVGRKVMASRLIGAGLMFMAIVLVSVGL
jgi:drug/metabolite transporter (DMT)-like permease